ncbi:MAG TPA: ATP-binding protein [Kofleriaceae bacterium]|nr:ATP-binding protein [Kofleriaceae bacterium]
MDVQAVSALLAALLILAIGTSVLLKNRTDRTYTSFAAFAFTVSAWQLCNFVSIATNSHLVRWLALWPAATIPPTAIAFFRGFLAQPSIGGPHRPPRVTLAWTFLAYLALVYSAVIHPIHDELYFQLPFGAYVFGGLYRCVYDLYVQYRATVKQVERVRIRYLALGGFVAITLALTDFLPRFDIAFPTAGNVLSILYLYFISQTLFRYRLIDINELVGKMAVLGTLVALLWAVYGLLLSWVGGGQEGLQLLNALVASFVILILFEPVRNWLENGINRWLVRTRAELRGRLDAVRRELFGMVDVGEMVKRIITALEESRRVTDAAIYLLDPDGAGYDRAGWFGQAPPDRLDGTAARAFLDRVRMGHLDLELLRREHDDLGADPAHAERRQMLAAAIAQTEELRAALVFPLLGSAETEQGPWLLGLLAVRDDRAAGAFDLDDIDMFRQLASQAARVIESSQAYERVKERERLAALGEMAAGLAHEIRNPLGAIKGAAQLLIGPDGQPVAPGPETLEFLDIIVEEVNRLNNVVTRFLDYARAEKAEPHGTGKVDVNAVVKKTVTLLQGAHDIKNVTLDVRLDELLPQVHGDPEALVQVFLNLGLNAVQAMPDGGTLEILTTRRRRSRLGYGQFAEVRFRDNGVGIARDKLKKLFIPFFTTKSRGTGLGLAISQRIVAQHGGTIEVRSTPGQGSTFSVFLPAIVQVAAPRDATPAPSPPAPKPETPSEPAADAEPSEPSRPRPDAAIG